MGRRKRLAISFSPNQISCQLHHVHRLTPLDLLTCTQMITTREFLKDRIDTPVDRYWYHGDRLIHRDETQHSLNWKIRNKRGHQRSLGYSWIRGSRFILDVPTANKCAGFLTKTIWFSYLFCLFVVFDHEKLVVVVMSECQISLC
jgi:hypothetical protein